MLHAHSACFSDGLSSDLLWAPSTRQAFRLCQATCWTAGPLTERVLRHRETLR